MGLAQDIEDYSVPLVRSYIEQGSISAQTATTTPNAPDTKGVRAAVKEVIQNAIARTTHKYPNGSTTILMPVGFKMEELDRIHSLGDDAIRVLAEYLPDNDSLHQMLALQLLARFASDKALPVFIKFAEHSRVRSYATGMMCQYPIEKTQPVLKKLAKDTDAEVRKAAKQCLKSSNRP